MAADRAEPIPLHDGLLLFQYGVAKILKIPVLPYFANPPPLIMTAGTLELILGALVMLGLFTRIAAFSCRARWPSPTSSAT